MRTEGQTGKGDDRETVESGGQPGETLPGVGNGRTAPSAPLVRETGEIAGALGGLRRQRRGQRGRNPASSSNGCMRLSGLRWRGTEQDNVSLSFSFPVSVIGRGWLRL